MSVQGVLPVLLLPYQEDHALDFATLSREIDWVFESGADGVVLAMVTEVFRLTDDERDRLARHVVDRVAGRGAVVVSVGAESIPQAVRLARSAENACATALMAVPPVFTRCPVDQLKQYYEAILSATGLPLIIQDASGYVGSQVPIALQSALHREYPRRIMFKPEAQPRSACISALRAATDGNACIFDGLGGMSLCDSFQRGVAGVMPSSDVPWAVAALWRALKSGDESTALRIQAPLSALVALMQNLDAFIAIGKALLVKQGIFKNALVRGPVGYQVDALTLRQFDVHLNCLKQACSEEVRR
jgi:dihydrodipicolinate synthase/N-acetylneuraminate lyase